MIKASLQALTILLVLLVLALPPNVAGSATRHGKPSHVIALFSGHTAFAGSNEAHQGAMSASGVPEYRFNDAVLELFSQQEGKCDIVYRAFPSTSNISLSSRPGMASELNAVALMEIHHDSVQPRIYRSLIRSIRGDPILDYYRGFSIHCYPTAESIRLAKAIESEMISRSMKWSEYHTEDIPGERMKLIRGTRAVYERRDLLLLRESSIPTVIIECGCIANPEEEKLVKGLAYRQRVVDAIHGGIALFLGLKQETAEEFETLSPH